jgi:hypothetical protein
MWLEALIYQEEKSPSKEQLTVLQMLKGYGR